MKKTLLFITVFVILAITMSCEKKPRTYEQIREIAIKNPVLDEKLIGTWAAFVLMISGRKNATSAYMFTDTGTFEYISGLDSILHTGIWTIMDNELVLLYDKPISVGFSETFQIRRYSYSITDATLYLHTRGSTQIISTQVYESAEADKFGYLQPK